MAAVLACGVAGRTRAIVAIKSNVLCALRHCDEHYLAGSLCHRSRPLIYSFVSMSAFALNY